MLCFKCQNSLIEGYIFCPYCLEKQYPEIDIVGSLEQANNKKRNKKIKVITLLSAILIVVLLATVFLIYFL